MYRIIHMGIDIVFTVCVIKCSVALIFFSFWITQPSINTDILGWSPEVRVNEILLYV